MVVQYLPLLRTKHEELMTDLVRIVRNGSVIYDNVPARLVQEREQTEPGDPHDASDRAMHEYGATIPYTYTNVREGDLCEKTDSSLSFIVGEAITTGTWLLAVRLWGSRPKVATPTVTISVWRYNSGIDDFANIGNFDVQLIFARVKALETPVRFSPDVQAAMQEGVVVGTTSFTPEIDDRFTYGGYSFVIDQILPSQTQRVEAHFVMDSVGAR